MQVPGEVQVIGCPPYDCVNREGNIWAERRLIRKRVPRLRRAYANAPITAVWLPPDQFADGLQTEPIMTIPEGSDKPEPNYLASRRMFPYLNWRNFVVAFALLAVVMVAQIFLTDIPFEPKPAQSAQLRVLIDNPAQIFERARAFSIHQNSVELRLEVDDELIMVEPFSLEMLRAQTLTPFYEEFTILPGSHDVNLYYVDTETAVTNTLFDEQINFQTSQIVRFQYQPQVGEPCVGDLCRQ